MVDVKDFEVRKQTIDELVKQLRLTAYNARKLAVTKFSIDVQGSRLESIYRTLLSGNFKKST